MPNARRTDPDTSWEAALSIDGATLNKVQKNILNLLNTAMCDQELVEEYRYWSRQLGDDYASDSSIRTRRAELVRKGLVVDTGERRKTLSGRNTVVWKKAEIGA
jgi:hypothetical protein